MLWRWVMPLPGKGALGTRWFRCLQEYPDTEPGEKLAGGRSEGAGKLGAGGVWVSEHWSIISPRKACFPENGVQSRGQNWTWKIRPSRIVGGLAETWTMVELGPRRTDRKGIGWELSTCGRARCISIPTTARRV